MSVPEVLELKKLYDASNPTPEGMPLKAVGRHPVLGISPIALPVVSQVVREGFQEPVDEANEHLHVTFDDLCEIVHLFSKRATHQEKAAG